MFKFLFKLFSVKPFLHEEPKQNNVSFDAERRKKIKKSIEETNQYYETLQQSYASRDDGFHHSAHDYSSSDDCSYSSSDSGSCDSGGDSGGCCGGGD